MGKTAILAMAVMGVLGGCAADDWRAQADRQASRLIEQRSDELLGYRPGVKISEEKVTAPGDAAYARIPTTPVAPAAATPIEPADESLPVAPLGPPVRATSEAGGQDVEQMSSTAPEDYAPATDEKLRLGPPTPGPVAQRFDLFESVRYAADNARDYRNQMDDLYLTALDVTLERHLFTPRPFVRQSARYDGGQLDSSYRSAINATTTAGVRQKLPYGGEVAAEALVSFVNGLHSNAQSGESAELALTATIPILRGAGMINLEPLIQSERDVVYQVRRFEEFRRSFVVNIATRYFNLVVQQQQVSNRRINLETLRALTKRTFALYEAGRINFLNVQQAQQELLSAETELINSQDAYSTAVDEFKLLIGMPISQELEIVPVDLDVAIPDATIEQGVDLAMRYRLDLQTARDQMEDRRRAVANAQNGLLPTLDFTAGVSGGNRSGTPAKGLDNRATNYFMGLNLDLPIDRVAERNNYRRALIQFQRQQRSYTDLEDRVSIAARDAIRSIRSAQQVVRIAELGIDLAQKRVDFANELLKDGRATTDEIVRAQRDLLRAQDQFSSAKARLRTEVLQYLRDTGTLRVSPDAGSLGRAMDPTGKPGPVMVPR